jgi:hypothetical protein
MVSHVRGRSAHFMIAVLGLFCRISGKIVPKRRSLMAQAGVRAASAARISATTCAGRWIKVLPGVPQHRPAGQRDCVVPAAVTAQPLGVPMPGPAVHPDRDPQLGNANSHWLTMRASPTVTQSKSGPTDVCVRGWLWGGCGFFGGDFLRRRSRLRFGPPLGGGGVGRWGWRGCRGQAWPARFAAWSRVVEAPGQGPAGGRSRSDAQRP